MSYFENGLVGISREPLYRPQATTPNLSRKLDIYIPKRRHLIFGRHVCRSYTSQFTYTCNSLTYSLCRFILKLVFDDDWVIFFRPHHEVEELKKHFKHVKTFGKNNRDDDNSSRTIIVIIQHVGQESIGSSFERSLAEVQTRIPKRYFFFFLEHD